MIHVEMNDDLKEELAALITGFTRGTILDASTLNALETKLMEVFFDYQCDISHVKFKIVQTGANDVRICPGNFYAALLFNGIIAPQLTWMQDIEGVLLDGMYPIYKSVEVCQGVAQ